MVNTTLYCTKEMFEALSKFCLQNNVLFNELIDSALTKLFENKNYFNLVDKIKSDSEIPNKDMKRNIKFSDEKYAEIKSLQNELENSFGCSCYIVSIVRVAICDYIGFEG